MAANTTLCVGNGGGQDIARVVVDSSSVPSMKDGDIIVKVDWFGFTANNLSYASAGQSLGYFKFFPSNVPGTAIVPVWGYGDVVSSRCSDVAVGERLYGYWPMAQYVNLHPTRVAKAHFYDGCTHRSSLPDVYNQYIRCKSDPTYSKSLEVYSAIVRPLFLTGFLLDDFLFFNHFFGADTVVVTSASSKTSLSLAWMLRRNTRKYTVDANVRPCIGLTSRGNVDFCERLGLYDQVIAYEDLEARLPDTATFVIVDMAGNGSLLSRFHNHARDRNRHTCLVGNTHWAERTKMDKVPGPKPKFFFAPEHIAKRGKAAKNLPGGMALSFADFAREAAEKGWFTIVPVTGADAVKGVYDDHIQGRGPPPSSAFICSMHDSARQIGASKL